MVEFRNFEYSGLRELEETEKNLVRYNNFIVKNFLKHSNFSGKVLDFGAGIGTLSNIWRNLNPNSDIYCLELDKKQLQILSDRNFKILTSLESPQKFEYIFTSNVLEHIENDMEALKQIYQSLNYKGGIGIFVPANQILYSNLDKKLNHFRRYSKKELENKVSSNGFKIEKCFYVDSIGFFALGIAKLLKLNLLEDNSKKLKFYDKVIWPISLLLDNLGFKFIFGKNLLLLAVKN